MSRSFGLRERTIQRPRSWTKNKSPTTAGVTVSDAELPSPWKIRRSSVVLKPDMVMPQAVAPNSVMVDKTRTGRLPKMFDRGTQKMLPNPRTKTLN